MKVSHIKTLLHAGKMPAVACIVSLLLSQDLFAQEVSRSFEFRSIPILAGMPEGCGWI